MRRIVTYGIPALVAVGLFFAVRHQQRQQIARHILMLGDTDVSAREEAEERLLGMGRAPVPQLVALIEHPQPRVVWRLADGSPYTGLPRHVRDSAESTQSRAARAHGARLLGRIGDRRAVPALARLATNPESRARRSGSDLLYQGGLRVLHDSPAGAAITALGQLGDARGVPALSETASDDRPFMRVLSAEALGRIGTEEAGTALLAMLDDGVEDVDFAVVVSLIRMRETRALPALPPLLGSSHETVRDAAARALYALGGERGIMQGVEWIGSSDAQAVYSATQAVSTAGGLKANSRLWELAESVDDSQRARQIRAALNSLYPYPRWADLGPGRRPLRLHVDLLRSADLEADDCQE